MKARYDRKTDTLSLIFRDNTPVFESDEDKRGSFSITTKMGT